MTGEILETASAAYYAGNPIMTDAEFDAAVIALRKKSPNHSFLKRIGAPVPGKNKAVHKIHMGSLDNANNEEEFLSWLPKAKTAICLSDKLDGSSIELIYQHGSFVKAITRGDGEVGEDVTKNVIRSGNISLHIDPSIVSVRCECLVWKDEWAEYFEGDANPRNSAAGTIRRGNGHNAQYLRFYAFDALVYDSGDCDISEACLSEAALLELLSEWFLTPEYVWSDDTHRLTEWIKTAENARDNLDYEVDGVVAKIDDREVSRLLGSRDNRPRGQIAIKFTPRGGETILRNVVWQVGHTGALTPVGIVDPVGVGGTIIRRATLCNPDEVARLDIAIGDKVEVVRAGDVIPKLSRRIQKGSDRVAIIPPSACPACGHRTYVSGAKLFCDNGNCEEQIIGCVMTWVNKRNILNIGEQLIISSRIRSVHDLYTMTLKDWANVEVGNGRFGEKRAAKVLEALEKSKSVSLPDFLGSLGIKGVGRSLMAKLCKSLSLLPKDQLTLKHIFLLDAKQVAGHEGFGEIRATDFCVWLREHQHEVKLLGSIMNLQYEVSSSSVVFKDETICFTGKSPRPRHEMRYLAERAGASVSTSINDHTTILVMADPDSTTTKAQKARGLGIRLMSPGDFLSQVGC